MWSGELCSYPGEHPREWEQDAQRLQMKCAEHTWWQGQDSWDEVGKKQSEMKNPGYYTEEHSVYSEWAL